MQEISQQLIYQKFFFYFQNGSNGFDKLPGDVGNSFFHVITDWYYRVTILK